MKEWRAITPEQEAELYTWKPNRGFHHKFIYDHKREIWIELTEEEALQKMQESSEKYRKSLLK